MNADRKKLAKELEKRTKKFAVRIIQLSTALPTSPEGKVVRNQLTKSGTSIGANYREANRSRSKADFKNKIAICESEASETQYWLEVIVETKWLSWDKVKPEYEGCGVGKKIRQFRQFRQFWHFNHCPDQSIRTYPGC